MKRSFFWALCAVLLFAVCIACEDRLEPVTQPDASAKRFMATTESPSTKTALSGNDTDGYEVNWQNGDQITVVDGAATPNVGIYTTTSTTPKGEFIFSGSGVQATTAPYQAYYPATLYNAGTLTLPATQTYVPGNISGSPMYATSENETLTFKNLCGIIRLNISTSQNGIQVKSVTLSAEQGMSGAFSISSESAVISSGTEGVTLDCGGSGVSIGSTPTAFFLSVPAGNYTGLNITVVTTNDQRQTRTAKKTISVERSSITDISLSFSNLTLSATDLSATETANTYIVSEAGTYKFKATVKGNSKSENISLSDIDGVTVLWELNSYGNAIKYQNSAYDIFLQDGYVYFRTPDTFTAGDAYVAVFKDGAGGTAGVYDKNTDEILWSWLIWATDTPGTSTVNGLDYLDRNLGATSTGHRGFCYQWGRKDPFSGCDRYSGNNVPYTFAPARTDAFQFSTDLASVAYTVAHPTTYIMTSTDAHWVTEADYGHLWWDYEKTIYDPCPAGWKVPSQTDVAIGFPGVGATGFIGSGSTTDFPYGNSDIGYYWTSTSENWNQVWGFYNDGRALQQDNHQRNGFAVRCVKDEVSNLEYTDLSVASTANSYIVPSAGNYKFKATVKGNGAANLAGINKTTAAADIASAALVWATFGTATAPADRQLIQGIHYKDGYVFFSTGNPYVEGNALVSVNDASGNILWSWHLWFESDNLESLKQTYPGGAVFMDRDLGARAPAVAAATDDINAYGLLYQWGRKDPFLNTWYTSKYGNTDGTKGLPAVQGTAEVRVSTYSVAKTIADAVQHPNWFYYNSITGETNWAADMVDGMWSGNKTIFDPCPPGWRVPDLSDWNDGFMTLFLNNSLDGDGNLPRAYKGISIDLGGSQTAYFPVSGLRYPTSLTFSGNYRCYGEGRVESPYKYHLHYWAQDGLLVRTNINGVEKYNKNEKLIYSQLKANTVYPETLSGGFSVRCVKE